MRPAVRRVYPDNKVIRSFGKRARGYRLRSTSRQTSQTGELSTTAYTAIATGPSSPANKDAPTVADPSTAIVAHAAAGYPRRRSRLQASASGRPHGAITINESQACGSIGNPNPRNTDVAAIPAGSQTSEPRVKAERTRAHDVETPASEIFCGFCFGIC